MNQISILFIFTQLKNKTKETGNNNVTCNPEPCQGPRRGPRTRRWEPQALVSSGNFWEDRVKEVAAHVRKSSPRGTEGASVQSAGAPKHFSPIVTAVITAAPRHGSGENTGENDRVCRRQVQQDSVHGRPLRTASGNFGSAGNEVRQAAACTAKLHAVHLLSCYSLFQDNTKVMDLSY